MKKFYGLFVLLATTVLLNGCDKQDKQSILTVELQHHRFTLIKANGEEVAPEKQAFIEFSEKLTYNGKMCNEFLGQASLNRDVIKSADFSSTQKLCDDQQLNNLDTIIYQMFKNGATVEIKQGYDNTLLQLKDKTNDLYFELKDLM